MGIHKYYFELKYENGKKSVDIKGYEDKSDAYVNLRDRICSNENIKIRQFENKYELVKSKHKIEFENKPWSNSSELISDIESMKNINNASFLPIYNRYHKPPELVVNLKDYNNIAETKKQLRSYCKDFDFRTENKNFYVILDPR